MDGARQIVIPATVSLLCICIVFVPMFNLGGVAGYLFRPMAEAVVFALIGSYVLSRTLVNTMARFLLAHQAPHGHGAPDRRRAILSPFPARIRAAVRSRARLLSTPARDRAGRAAANSSPASWSRWPARSRSPRSWAEFLSADRQHPAQAPRSRADRDPDRGHCADLRRGRRGDPPDHSPPRRWVRSSTTSDCRSAASIRPTTIPARSVRRRRHPDHDQARVRERGGPLHQGDARDAAETVSGRDLRVPARGHRLPNSQFRPSRADRRAGRRLQLRRQPRLRQQVLQKIAPGPRRRGRANPAGVQQSDVRRRGRPRCARRKSA